MPDAGGRAPEEWIIVPNWDRFQHYSDRTPVWIKLYLELRDKDEYRHLTYAQRGCLTTIWMEFGASKGVLRVSSLAQKSGQRTRRQHLDPLVRAGFIQLSASKPLALARSREKKRKEKERVREGEQAEAARHTHADNNDTPDPDDVARVHALVSELFE